MASLLVLLNVLLIPPFFLVLVGLYFLFFGGPLPHHYLYTATVAGPTATPAAVAAADEALASKSGLLCGSRSVSAPPSAHSSPTLTSSAAASAMSSLASMLLPRKNNRSPTFVSVLHRIRVACLGVDEQTRHMRAFRTLQGMLWRLYKRLLRRLTHTGELERMIGDAQLSMIPLGSCLDERVGFHPHLIALSVRIAAYLRSSTQLKEVLAMEEEQAKQDRLRGRSTAATTVGAGGSSALVLDASEDDATPLSTPAMDPLHGNLDPPALLLGGAMNAPLHASTPLLARPSAVGSALATPANPSAPYQPGFVRSNHNLSSLNSYLATSSSSSSGQAQSPSRASGSSAAASSSLAYPPVLRLNTSDQDHSQPRPTSYRGSSGGLGGDYTAAQDARANHLLQLLVAVKHINRTSPLYASTIRPVLYRALIYRNDVNDFLTNELAPVLAIRYDKANPAHESWLMELWALTLPKGPSHPTPAGGPVSPDWTLLGFQGPDPSTDFRGMGVLGLRNLMEFARLAPIHAGLIMRRCQEQGIKWFGMAITGIALTADLVQLARSHALDAYFAAYGANWHSWHALYTTLFVRFDEYWQEKSPPNVMSYSAIHSTFLTSFTLEATTFPFNMVALSSSAFDISAITPVTPRANSAQAMANMMAPGGMPPPPVSLDDDDIGADADDELERELGAERVMTTSRRSSKSASRAAHFNALSRSASPLSRSASLGFPLSGLDGGHSSDDSNDGSPFSPVALSRSDMLDANGGVAPLGNWLDPLQGLPPQAFAAHTLPDWHAKTVTTA